MKKILLITTGGTIASIQTNSGLIPGIDGKKLIEYLPNIKDKCIVDVKGLFNIDSTNVYYKHWLEIAKCIKENYELLQECKDYQKEMSSFKIQFVFFTKR